MIVDPDFLDHWRTRMLVDALNGDEMVPLCLIRLWAHCQVRRGDRFEMPAAGIKAQCRYTGDAQAFEDALIEAKFIERDGSWIHVLGWAEQNASLLAAWENGGKGGRPRKEPKQNPRVTKAEPTGNPAVTHGEPERNPSETDKSREEKRRDTDPDGSGADAPAGAVDKQADSQKPSSKDIVFALGVPLLVAAGVIEKNARSFLAMQCKAHTDPIVADALEACSRERPVEPLTWLQAKLKPHVARTGRHTGFASKNYREGVTEDGSFT